MEGYRYWVLTKRIVDADCPSHSLFTLYSWEDLGGILEGHRAFSERIAYSEQINKTRQTVLAIGLAFRVYSDVIIDSQNNWADSRTLRSHVVGGILVALRRDMIGAIWKK